VLVFSPLLAGHREVYMNVLTDVALNTGHDVVLAAGFGPAGSAEPCVHLDRFRDDERVLFVDVSGYPAGGLDMSLQELTRLARANDADVTALAHADNHLRLLSAQVTHPAWRLPGRRVAVFISSTNLVHKAWRDRTPREWARYYRHLPRRWRQDPGTFHRLVVPGLRAVDAALCLDEVFVAGKGPPYAWMPDIAAPLGACRRALSDEAAEWQARAHEFLEQNAARPALVYYGTAQARRGYDTLLRLAVEEDACVLHAGLRDDAQAYAFDVAGLRRELARRGALLESRAYHVEFDTADVFMRCAHHLVLPYRGHYGSSGVMLQALRAGRPVLVPDIGLMAHRVRRFGLGGVYRHGDWHDLRRRHRALCETDPAGFRPGIERFLRFFTDTQIVASLEHALGVGAAGAVVPSATSR
jgi:hypothetical protein